MSDVSTTTDRERQAAPLDLHADLLAALVLAEELPTWYARGADPKWNGVAAPTSVLGEARAAIAKAKEH